MDWQKRVTAEKSLWDVYKKARTVCSTRANLLVAVIAFLSFMALLIADICYGIQTFSEGHQRRIAEAIGQYGFSFTTALLGFLIAGFSIFASITRPEIFAMLAQIEHKKSSLTRLQFIFFNFMFVFIHYLAFLAVCLSILLLLPILVNLFTVFIAQSWLSSEQLAWIAGVGNALLFGWLTFLVMLLKSFIWNIYQAVLLVIVTSDLVKKDTSANHPSNNAPNTK